MNWSRFAESKPMKPMAKGRAVLWLALAAAASVALTALLPDGCGRVISPSHPLNDSFAHYLFGIAVGVIAYRAGWLR